MQTIAQHRQLVEICLQIAAEKYGTLPKVAIRYDLKGRSAGQAGHDGRGNYFLRFNKEALIKDWEYMVSENIPHEVAHIVAYAKPELGASGHNYGWQRIAHSMGCTGNRCHKMALTPRGGSFTYKLPSGLEIRVGKTHHQRIQQFGTAAGIQVRRTREILDRHHFVAQAA